MRKVHFSIATPTRNAFDKLKRCVGSIRGQKGAAYEHLVQDALSTDGSSGWLAQQTDLLSMSEADTGMYDAINRAWARSSGEFLSWLNADEQYLPGTLEKVMNFFEAHPEVDIVFGDYIVADQHGRPVALRREIPFRRAYVANGFLNMSSCTTFFRRRLLEKDLLRLDTRYRYAADKDLILRLASSGAVIKRIPEYLAVFGIDGTNLSTHPAMETEIEAIRLTNGAFRSRTLRRTVLLGRYFERLFQGGYRSQPICFHYAINEKPDYVEVSATALSGRYSLADINGRADALRPIEPS